MAIQCDFVGSEDYAQPPFQITTHCVRRDGVNGKAENDEPEGRLVQFEEVARVAAAVCLPKELLAEAEMGSDLSFCAAKVVSFDVVGSLPSVGVDLGCRKISSSEFRFERQSRLIGLTSAPPIGQGPLHRFVHHLLQVFNGGLRRPPPRGSRTFCSGLLVKSFHHDFGNQSSSSEGARFAPQSRDS